MQVNERRLGILLKTGTVVLWFLLFVSLAIVLALTALHPPLGLAAPALLVVFMALVATVKRPLLHLASVLFLFVLVARFEEGFQIVEALYGLYFLAYLGVFAASTRTPFAIKAGRALLAFFAWVILSFTLTFVFDGSFKGALSEAAALMFVGLFFPVAYYSGRSLQAIKVVLSILVVLAVVVVVRNILTYAQAFSSAVYVYEIARGRVITNEVLILSGTLITMSMLCAAKLRVASSIICWTVFTLLLGGLLLTQSRTYWLAFALGLCIEFLLLRGRDRRRLLTASLASVTALIATAYMVVPDYVILIISGLIERMTSIGSAASSDISMINRFLEVGAVWEKIVLNPIVGHGMGSTYRFYDITFELTRAKAFVHNGYIALWFKFGIVGLMLMLVFICTCTRKAFIVTQTKTNFTEIHVAALSSIAVLSSLLLTSLTTNPFYLSDTTYIIGVMTGLAIGSYKLSSLA